MSDGYIGYILVGLSLAFVSYISSCSSFNYGKMEQVKLSFASSPPEYEVLAKIAKTSKEKALGLMNIKTLAPNSGMLFYYGKPDNYQFWMKNTYLSLDIIFMDCQWKIIDIKENTEPLSEKIISANKESCYILELLAGSCKKNHIKISTYARLKKIGDKHDSKH